jgi:hypothetical protein
MLWGAGRLLWRLIQARGIARPRPAGVRLLPVVVALGLLTSVPGSVGLVSVGSHSPGATGDPLEVTASSRTRSAGLWRANVWVEGPVLSLELPAPPARVKRTALIVGIDRAKGGRPLPGSVTDAKNVRDALLAYGFPKGNIRMLINGDATKSVIRSELASLAKRTPKDGVAVFAVATHTRKRGGHNEFLTADGGRIAAPELAVALGRVRSKMWVALPTCYAAGYALKGIVGPGRVATFASPASQPTYQLGTAGSYLIINMVRDAMLRGYAPRSVEEAFHFARAKLERTNPNRVPIINDGVKGELVLGRPSRVVSERHDAYVRAEADAHRREVRTEGAPPQPDDASDVQSDQSSDASEPPKKSGVGFCAGGFRYRCAGSSS